MNANERELLLREEVFAVAGAAMEVLNVLGHGLIEKPYENALVIELGMRSIPVKQQPRYAVNYKGTVVGEYVPDLIAFQSLVVETKVIEQIGNHELGQMMNYLKITGMKVGMILNFKRARLERLLQNPSWHGRLAHESRARCPCHIQQPRVLQEPLEWKRVVLEQDR